MHIKSQIHFERIGRVEQLRITDCRGLAGILEIDQAHWIATSAPIASLRVDPVFLARIDSDQNGRIRADELCAAIRWLLGHLKDPRGVNEQSDTLILGTIDTTSEEGERIFAQIEKILCRLDKENQQSITLDDIRTLKRTIEQSNVSEAGIAIVDAADNEKAHELLTAIVAVTGGADHPSGHKGVGTPQLSAFLEDFKQYEKWVEKEDQVRESLTVFGQSYQQAYELYRQMAPKFDSYFAQCLALTQDPTLASRFALPADRVQATDFHDLNSVRQLLSDAPIAKPCPKQTYSFEQPTNTVYIKALKRFADEILVPLNMDTLNVTAQQWQLVHETFHDYDQWVTNKPTSAIVTMPVEKIRELTTTDSVDMIRHLINTSNQTAIELNEIRRVEQLALYQAHMIELANNFVSFPYLYDPKKIALFEHGSLVMDGRRFNMAIRVDNRKEHINATASSDIFVIYVLIRGINDETDLELAFPVTSGGKGNITLGKRGIFHNLKGETRDAQIVHLVENPISLTEALIAPFKRITSLITGKIEKLTTSAEKNLDQATDTTSTAVQNAGSGSGGGNSGVGTSGGGGGMMAGGVLAAGSLAIAALGSAAAYIAQIFMTNGIFKILGGLLAALVAVMIPVAIVALIKLVKRDLSCMLEGAGWAINACMRLTRQQADQFTHRPLVPGVVHRWFTSPVFLGAVSILIVIGLLYLFGMFSSQAVMLPANS
ncbi:MAG: hypothetical protein JKX85_07000 [Phycisphaeraceae bacterium]|nr:hypothetical protein [Phycisphaeraceae bacterium]